MGGLNLISVLILALIAVGCFFAIRYTHRHGSCGGCEGCSGSCSSCGGCQTDTRPGEFTEAYKKYARKYGKPVD